MLYKTIISVDDLKNNLDKDDFIIFDSRCDIKDSGYGIDSYTEGHIPNSIFVDVDTDLASEKRQGTGRHPLPDPNTFSEKLSHWGMSNNKQVVVYDDAGGAFARPRAGVPRSRALGARGGEAGGRKATR